MTYAEEIAGYTALTMQEVVQTARKYVPEEYRSKPWNCPGLNHGTACLETEAQLCCYLAAYGQMHVGKLDKILESFPFGQMDASLELVDWGCGQGVATVRMVQALREAGRIDRLRRVTLIEPSAAALTRARLHVEHCVPNGVSISAVEVFLPGADDRPNTLREVEVLEPICIHLFSNILDIASIDLKKLAQLIGRSGYRHYFVCVGPDNSSEARINQFSRYFEIPSEAFYLDFRAGQFRQLDNKKWYSCIAKGWQMVRQEGKPFLVPLSYYPPKQFFAAYRIDAFGPWGSCAADDADELSTAFEVLAPFDLGANIYEDVHPILAVLNNIITRGLPTRCSPLVEEALSAEYGHARRNEQYGTLSYPSGNPDALRQRQTLLREIPLAIARVQKVVVEALLTGRLDLWADHWDVLVKEGDVPCGALALEDLRATFDHLTALSRDYDRLRFPELRLHVVSPHHADSPLHRGAATYTHTARVDRSRTFDLVIDIAIHEMTDAAHVEFVEFRARRDCYFNVRSSRCVYGVREIYTSDPIVYKPLTKVDPGGGHRTVGSNATHLNYLLTLLFRKTGFRPGQLPILNRALQGKPVIGLLPTGGGKSLTYQLAALLQPGVTVVVDPLKSLMEDQYEGLLAAGIDCCTYINGELSPQQKRDNELRMERSQVLFTFLSPERLCIYEFRERLRNMHQLHVYFSYGVIDEVHCVSEWGHDFRFSYLHLGRNLCQYVRGKRREITLFGLTATASFDVLSDVERELTGGDGFAQDPELVVRYENTNRLELQYKIERVEIEYQDDPYYRPTGSLAGLPRAVNIGDTWTAYGQKSDFLVSYLRRIPGYLRELQTDRALTDILAGFREREMLENPDPECLRTPMPDDCLLPRESYPQAGIVFCPHVKATGVSVLKVAQKLNPLCQVGVFYGADDTTSKANPSMDNMRRFRENRLPVMVATKAFGMGIDKPNVRYTVNMNYSSSLESFVQEAGRGGRDRHLALAVILVSDYHLVRINPKCPRNDYPFNQLKGRWFKEQDMQRILSAYGIERETNGYIEHCTPESDMVRFKCNISVPETAEKVQPWSCPQCSKRERCQLQRVGKEMRGWITQKEMDDYLARMQLRIPRENVEYQNPDFRTVIYFFDNNFKGELNEKRVMHELMSQMPITYFLGDDRRDKPAATRQATGFLDVVLSVAPGTEVVAWIGYTDSSAPDISKAIYRMCLIGLIDDFTQDYAGRRFRIVLTRKPDGGYYERLHRLLLRYYNEERAHQEIGKARGRKGDNEIHRCLGYLTEFVYDKVVSKRRQAIEDMRRFCMTGIRSDTDWRRVNETLKDDIYYYFNSKFAREDNRADNGEFFSLLQDTDRARSSSFEIVLKYLRVTDPAIMGTAGSPKDTIKHLQGAVRLIRRSETEPNGVLRLLDVFCLLMLRLPGQDTLSDRMKECYAEGYRAFRQQMPDWRTFASSLRRYHDELCRVGAASAGDIATMEDWALELEVSHHALWVERFARQYNE